MDLLISRGLQLTPCIYTALCSIENNASWELPQSTTGVQVNLCNEDSYGGRFQLLCVSGVVRLDRNDRWTMARARGDRSRDTLPRLKRWPKVKSTAYDDY